MTPEDNGNGVEHIEVPTITLLFDPRTSAVAISTSKNLPLGLAQMILDEGVRLLDIQRRQAAAIELRNAIAQAEENARVAAALRQGV